MLRFVARHSSSEQVAECELARQTTHCSLRVSKSPVQRVVSTNLLTSGTRVCSRKNIDGLLRAYAQYRAACAHPWGMVIAGGGPEQAAWQELESSIGLEGVLWPGFVQYGDLFYEIVKTYNDTRYYFGQVDHKFQISAECVRAREGTFRVIDSVDR